MHFWRGRGVYLIEECIILVSIHRVKKKSPDFCSNWLAVVYIGDKKRASCSFSEKPNLPYSLQPWSAQLLCDDTWTIMSLPFQWAHCLCFRLLWCHCDVGCCHLLSLECLDSSRYCYCSSWGCAAAGPAAGEPVSVGHPSSGSHPERGYQSAQEFHWSHTCLLLEDPTSRTMQMNSMPSNYCNLEALHQNTSVLHANIKYASI